MVENLSKIYPKAVQGLVPDVVPISILHRVYGDRGYRGCEGVIVCGSREMRAKRQVVEGVISHIKNLRKVLPEGFIISQMGWGYRVEP